MRRGTRAAMALLAAVGALLLPTTALAHPLGNFTINRYSGIEVAGDQLRLHYVLDMAEIPTLQERQAIGADATYPDQAAYLAARAADLAHNLDLRIDGRRQVLQLADKAISFPAGQAGLSTLRIELLLTAPAGGLGRRSAEYVDENYQGRLGWKEITVSASGGAHLNDSSAPAKSLSNELRAYPQDRLASPSDSTSARFTYVPGLAAVGAPAFLSPATGGFRVIQDRYASLIAQDLTPFVVALSILLAVALGGAHALSPGHGKAVMAGYLVGSRRSPKHAVILGLTITTTHTIGVFALGLITLFASALITPERLYPWLTLVSGALVLALGITLVVSRTRAALASDRGGAEGHAHDDESHHHPHDHGSGPHTHAPPPRTGLKGLLMLGISGGLIPCPSALLVLLSAIALHRVVLGIVLIVAFSVGLALVLTGIGVAVAMGLPLLARMPGRASLGSGIRVIRFASVLGAAVLTIAGMGLTLQAIPQVL